MSRKPEMSKEDIASFWSQVVKGKNRACWEWNGSRDGHGYGRYFHGGRHHGAHRVALFLTGGVWPGELFALHSCDNPPCCNPNHLRIGDAFDNSMDMQKRRRGKGGPRPGNPRAFINGPVAQSARVALALAVESLGESIYKPDGTLRYGALVPIKLEVALAHGISTHDVERCAREVILSAKLRRTMRAA